MLNELCGYSLSVYSNSQIFHQYYGFREIRPKNKKVTEHTFYDIASLTKTYTAVLIFIAYEDGYLELDDFITKYEKNFKNLNNVKIRDLLCHNQEIWTKGYIGDAENRDKYLKILFSSYIKSSKPKYVDIDYIILGYLLEVIYSKSLKELIYEKIILRLNLTETTFEPIGEIASTKYENQINDDFNVGDIHDRKARLLKTIDVTCGHASLFATSNDLLLFLLSIMNYEILKKETVDMMLKHYDINGLNKNKNWDCKTYNFMGARYFNDLDYLNDVPNKGNIISFSGYTGPRYLIDFDNKLIIVLMCNVVHNCTINRKQRFELTKNIVFNIYNELLQKNKIY